MKHIENYFKNAERGDKVVDIILDKEGVIEDTEYLTKYPIKVVFNDTSNKYYTIDGRENINDKTQRLFYRGYEPKIEIPEPPKRKFEFTKNMYQYEEGINIGEEVIGEESPYVIAVSNVEKSIYIDEEDLKYGRYRKTKESAEQALSLQTRVMRLHALAEQLGGLKEWKKGEENYYIYKEHNKNWIYDYTTKHYFPETVYMTKKCAEKICEMLNNGEFSLEVGDE